VTHALLTSLLLVLPTQSAPPSSQTQATACAEALSAAADVAAAELCAADNELRRGTALRANSRERTDAFQGAASRFRRAATLASSTGTRRRALDLLAVTYDSEHLDDAVEMEQVLRELIGISPDDLAPVFRLAKLQEDRGLIDAAETTLIDARHRQPDAEEPNRRLAQFYARLVTALHKRNEQAPAAEAASSPGEPDASGVYRIGGSLKPPARSDVPQYPPEAQAAGITGSVVAEVTIDTSGNVTAARVVNSIPMLDEAALQAVRNWRFAPTLVNGQPVPVRMVLTVNFTTKR
jgi:TonB family protein